MKIHTLLCMYLEEFWKILEDFLLESPKEKNHARVFGGIPEENPRATLSENENLSPGKSQKYSLEECL